MNRGVAFALGAYLTWGITPIFWKALDQASPLEITAHRVMWSVILLTIVLSARRSWRTLGRKVGSVRTFATYVLTGSLLLGNWLTYVFAVNTDRIVETSLGYFINPLVSVVLGVVFLHERLRFGQWVAVAVASAGVLYLTFGYGTLPWIALTLAFSFGLYGLLRKTGPLGPIEGLWLEMVILVPAMIGVLGFLGIAGSGQWGHASAQIHLLFVMTGLVTTVPLLLFNIGARLTSLSLLGFLQYIAPSMQFLLGIYLYQEPFTAARLIGFAFVWSALLVYTIEGLFHRRVHPRRLAHSATHRHLADRTSTPTTRPQP